MPDQLCESVGIDGNSGVDLETGSSGEKFDEVLAPPARWQERRGWGKQKKKPTKWHWRILRAAPWKRRGARRGRLTGWVGGWVGSKGRGERQVDGRRWWQWDNLIDHAPSIRLKRMRRERERERSRESGGRRDDSRRRRRAAKAPHREWSPNRKHMPHGGDLFDAPRHFQLIYGGHRRVFESLTVDSLMWRRRRRRRRRRKGVLPFCL